MAPRSESKPPAWFMVTVYVILIFLLILLAWVIALALADTALLLARAMWALLHP